MPKSQEKVLKYEKKVLKLMLQLQNCPTGLFNLARRLPKELFLGGSGSLKRSRDGTGDGSTVGESSEPSLALKKYKASEE